ncbi:hypothetical protein DCC62_30180 [candidate division KSB1 bacterium]|nr:MAG: hypothetical protein DCC62_30180 [candidate division KSB1 bacterium]
MPFNESRKQRIPVLLYHRIDTEADKAWQPFCVSPDDFARQMAWLAQQGYRTIDLHALLNYYERDEPVPEKALVITFDDGYYCNYSRAFPLMAKYDFTGTVFLAGNLMRADDAPPAESRQGFMSWNEIRDMHVKMTDLSRERLHREIFESREVIAAQLGAAVDFFCYPFAAFDSGISDCVQEAGYRGACGGPPFYEEGPASPFAIGRTEILWNDSFAQFRFKIENGLSYYFFARRQMGKVKRALQRE